MPVITFYRQARRDGCIRTGVELDGDVLFGRLEGGSTDFDPVLTWYVELQCAGENLPQEAEVIRQWLIDRAPFFQTGRESLAQELDTGLSLQPGLEPELARFQGRGSGRGHGRAS